MTCIVGIARDGIVHMGGDSAGSDKNSIDRRSHPKVFQKANYLIGYTTSFRMGQLLEYTFTPPRYAESDDLLRFMVSDWIDGVRATLKAGGYAHMEHATERGGEFLVGTRGRLFHVESDYQVGEVIAGYDAAGSGSAYALGALYATETEPLTPMQRLRIALEAATEHSPFVRGPFTFMELSD